MVEHSTEKQNKHIYQKFGRKYFGHKVFEQLFLESSMIRTFADKEYELIFFSHK